MGVYVDVHVFDSRNAIQPRAMVSSRHGGKVSNIPLRSTQTLKNTSTVYLGPWCSRNKAALSRMSSHIWCDDATTDTMVDWKRALGSRETGPGLHLSVRMRFKPDCPRTPG